MFAKQVQKDVKVGDETVLIRKLSAKTLEKARGARRADQVQNMRDIGADLIKAFRERNEEAKAAKREAAVEVAPASEPTPEEREKARRATFPDYDMEIVLNGGIVRWTAKIDGKAVPVNPESVGELDEETAKILFEEILDLSVKAADATEAQGKG